MEFLTSLKSHTIVGRGLPVTWHVTVTFSPNSTVLWSNKVAFGGTKEVALDIVDSSVKIRDKYNDAYCGAV